VRADLPREATSSHRAHARGKEHGRRTRLDRGPRDDDRRRQHRARRAEIIQLLLLPIAPRKRGRGESDEHLKPLNGIQLVRIQPGQSRSGQAGSESCTCAGRLARRSVDNEGAGRADSAPKSVLVADADVVRRTEGCIAKAAERGFSEPPESLARGTLSQGFPTNVGDLLVSAVTGVPRSQGRPKTAGMGVEKS
jgi:hypothetical protein